MQRLSWVAPNSTSACRNRSFIFTCSQSTAPTWVCSNPPHRACVVPLKHDELFKATLLLTAVSRSFIRSALFYRSWAASAEHCGMLVTAVLPSQTEIHRQVMQSLALCLNYYNLNKSKWKGQKKINDDLFFCFESHLCQHLVVIIGWHGCKSLLVQDNNTNQASLTAFELFIFCALVLWLVDTCTTYMLPVCVNDGQRRRVAVSPSKL